MSTPTTPTARLPRERVSLFDPPPDYRDLQVSDPVSPLVFPDGGSGWVVTRYDDVRALFADPRFSSRRSFAMNPVRETPEELRPYMEPEPGQFIGLDPPEHTRYRQLLTGQFTVRRMRGSSRASPRSSTSTCRRCRRRGRRATWSRSFALPVPSLVICELLGVPYGDRALFQQRTRTLLVVRQEGGAAAGPRGAARVHARAGAVQARRAGRATCSARWCTTTARTAWTTRSSSTSACCCSWPVTRRPPTCSASAPSRCCATPPAGAAARRPGLVDTAVEELLRYLTIIQFGLVRVATEDVTLHDRSIRAGEPVVLSVPAANRDPAHFPDPDRLDLGREPTGHLAFGHGVHQCLGQQLARVEMRIGFSHLLAALPGLRLAVPVEQVRMRDDMFIYGVKELPVSWDAGGAGTPGTTGDAADMSDARGAADGGEAVG